MPHLPPLANAQVRELSNGVDLFLRDRFRKAYAALPSLLAPPRLPFLPALPSPPLPPVFVPGLGLVSVAWCGVHVQPEVGGCLVGEGQVRGSNFGPCAMQQ